MGSRRTFLQAAAGIGLATPFRSTATGADESLQDLVDLQRDILPTVELIERTPRNQVFAAIGKRLKQGLPHRNLTAAIFLAGIRNVSPQPPGFKFHCVFVVHAAHQMSLNVASRDRLMPLFFALDAFKASQQRDVEEGDFRLGKVTGKIPQTNLWREFHEAMDAWDEGRSDRAIVALTRSRGAHEIIDQMWRYGARDYRNIGHKAIFVANTWRTLQTIGWRHAEPALRSLVLGLLDFGKSQRVNDYTADDQCYAANWSAAKKTASQLPSGWLSQQANSAATLELLAAIRTGDVAGACRHALDALTTGKQSAQSMWDGAHLAAGELMMQQPGIYGIHTVTSVSALHYGFEMAAAPETRLFMLLQAVGWMAQFRNFMGRKTQGLRNIAIDKLQPAAPTSLEKIFGLIGRDAAAAATAAMSLDDSDAFQSRAQQLILSKGQDAHDYKYSISIFEDYQRVSPSWKPYMLATSAYYLRGADAKDSPVMTRAREVIQSL